MGYTSWSVVYGEQPSAAKWNILGANDASFNDGTGIGTSAIVTASIADDAVTTAKIADDAVTPAKWTNPYCFKAYNSTTTTLTDAAFSQILFQTVVYDYNNNFASSAYTAPVTGIYNFSTGVGIDSAVSTAVDMTIAIYVNGVEEIRGTRVTTGSDFGLSMAGDTNLTAGDTVTVYFYQNSAGNESTRTGEAFTWFAGHLVHAT